eukprot:CAMPEP_0194408242 /NCGR_PEP_ID=MMETSP0176-20130528/6180_1 /TAXON_ID=216777 /ORGANISM="Proboscia alata, Strain PI-D3" /LENGTH=666 /DNA_ID=CAMNT_0039208269 /DNA_START=151 /DNA_END=2151 /DNA_ORIENTATION=+
MPAKHMPAKHRPQPLLYKYAASGDYDSLIERVQKRPNEAKYQDKLGDTPLHKLVYENENIPLNAVKSLVTAFLGAVKVRDKDGCTPLDVAIRYDASDEVIDFLRGSMERLSERSKGGASVSKSFISTSGPKLYDYAFNRSYKEVIRRCRSHPHEAEYQSEDGSTTLHWLAFYGAPLESIDAVVKAHSGTLQFKDNDGHTPLDVAVNHTSASDDIINYLKTAKQNLIRDSLDNLCSLQIEVKRLTQNNVVLSTQVSSLTDLCTRLRDDNDAAKNDLETSDEAARQGMDTKTWKTISKFQADLEKMNEKFENQALYNKQIEATNSEMARHMTTMKTDLMDRNYENKSLRQDLTKLHDRVVGIAHQIEHVKNNFDEAEFKQRSMEKKFDKHAKMMNKLGDAESRYQEQQDDLDMLKRDRNEYTIEVEKIKMDIDKIVTEKMEAAQTKSCLYDDPVSAFDNPLTNFFESESSLVVDDASSVTLTTSMTLSDRRKQKRDMEQGIRDQLALIQSPSRSKLILPGLGLGLDYESCTDDEFDRHVCTRSDGSVASTGLLDLITPQLSSKALQDDIKSTQSSIKSMQCDIRVADKVEFEPDVSNSSESEDSDLTLCLDRWNALGKSTSESDSTCIPVLVSDCVSVQTTKTSKPMKSTKTKVKRLSSMFSVRRKKQ